MLIAQLLCLKAQNVKRKPAPSKKKKTPEEPETHKKYEKQSV